MLKSVCYAVTYEIHNEFDDQLSSTVEAVFTNFDDTVDFAAHVAESDLTRWGQSKNETHLVSNGIKYTRRRDGYVFYIVWIKTDLYQHIKE